jgi:molybdenum cofactor cytidylyltransferase
LETDVKFGSVSVRDAVGAVLAHGVKHAAGVFKKGRVLSQEDVAALVAQGVAEVVVARLNADDVPEDVAARQVAVAACGSGAKAQEPFTGRANLYATAKGLVVFDEARLRAINHLHESLTIATLPNYARVEPKQMVATIKVIPFAVPRAVLEQALAILAEGPLLRVAAFQPRNAALITTTLPQTKPSIVTKGETAVRERLEAMGATLAHASACKHAQADVAAAISAAKGYSPILVLGASAIVDRADVIPAAVGVAGGEVVHVGMPVDPGNLLMLGALGDATVIGVPSCARSPKINGFDWALERVIADVPLTASDIMDMGAGGLLAEIPSRPTPREGQGAVPTAAKVVAVVLAAGLSSRMGSNKLLADVGGQPMIMRTLAAIKQSAVDEIVLVLGRDADVLEKLVADTSVRAVRNPDYASGMASSIRVGVQVAGDADAVLVCLGDMPLLQSQTINKLIAAFNPTEHRNVIVPVFEGAFGNPVLWGREHFRVLTSLTGDKGARSLLPGLKDEVVEVSVDDPGVMQDVDTPEALARLVAGQ